MYPNLELDISVFRLDGLPPNPYIWAYFKRHPSVGRLEKSLPRFVLRKRGGEVNNDWGKGVVAYFLRRAINAFFMPLASASIYVISQASSRTQHPCAIRSLAGEISKAAACRRIAIYGGVVPHVESPSV